MSALQKEEEEFKEDGRGDVERENPAMMNPDCGENVSVSNGEVWRAASRRHV